MKDFGKHGPKEFEVVSLEVTEDYMGIRLDQFLTAHIADRTRSQIQRLIKDGRARVGNKIGRASTHMYNGDVVRLTIPPPAPTTPQAQVLPLEIVYDDTDIVVVNKPPGMVVHPAPGHAEGTLVNALLHHVKDLSGIGGELRPGIVHRLDRGTSGLMVVAKHDQAHAELSRQFKDREVEKEYVALVWGVVKQGRRIDLPIGRDPVHRKKISERSRRARTAVSRVTQAEKFDGLSLLRVTIVTGRTHQIRVHLSAIGHPIVGDTEYDGKKRHIPPRFRAVRNLNRPFLHAARLAFTHPKDGRTAQFSCALPPDLEEILNELRVATIEGETKR